MKIRDKKFEIKRRDAGYACNILEEGVVCLHLNPGTVRNEENIDRIVDLLNKNSQDS